MDFNGFHREWQVSLTDDISRIIRHEIGESKEGSGVADSSSSIDELMKDPEEAAIGPYGGLSELEYMELMSALEETVMQEILDEGATTERSTGLVSFEPSAYQAGTAVHYRIVPPGTASHSACDPTLHRCVCAARTRCTDPLHERQAASAASRAFCSDWRDFP